MGVSEEQLDTWEQWAKAAGWHNSECYGRTLALVAEVRRLRSALDSLAEDAAQVRDLSVAAQCEAISGDPEVAVGLIQAEQDAAEDLCCRALRARLPAPEPQEPRGVEESDA